MNLSCNMKNFNILSIVLGVLYLLRGILAQECKTTELIDVETGETILRVTSQDQLDAFRNGCTILTGHIWIDTNYSGDFILNGIINFSGNISMDQETPAPNMGILEMLDLEKIDTLILYQVNDVHLPKLQHAGNIYLLQTSSSGEVDLGSLVDASNLQIEGSWTSIKLSSLNTVNYRLQLCAIEGCAIMPNLNPPALVIDLPNLEAANYFEVAGAIKSVSIPRLERVGDHAAQDPEWDWRGFRVNTQGPELEVEAPKLHTLEGSLEIFGTITSLKLGALGKTGLSGTFTTDTAIYFYSTLETANQIYFWGNIKGIYLPNLVHIGTVDIYIDHNLPCTETVFKLWEAIPYFHSSNNKYRCHGVTVSEDDLYSEDDTSDENPATSDDTSDKTPNTSDEDLVTSGNITDTSSNDDLPDIKGNSTFHTGCGNHHLSHVGSAAIMIVAVISTCYL